MELLFTAISGFFEFSVQRLFGNLQLFHSHTPRQEGKDSFLLWLSGKVSSTYG